MIKKIAYVVLMVLFGIYLFFSSKIIASAYGDHFVRSREKIRDMHEQYAFGAIDVQSTVGQSVFEDVMFVGWAKFMDSQLDENYRVGIALESTKGEIYRFDAPPNYFRQDVRSSTDDTIMHGYEFTISMALVPSGKYKVYVYCVDQDNHMGVVSTLYMVEKKGKDITMYNWTSDEVDGFSPSKVDTAAKSHFDTNTVNKDGSATLYGWSYVPGQETSEQAAYVLLRYADGTTAVYDAQRVSRPDMSKYLGDKMYFMSGFRAEIPAELLHSKEFTACVVIQDDQGTHASKKEIAEIKAMLDI